MFIRAVMSKYFEVNRTNKHYEVCIVRPMYLGHVLAEIVSFHDVLFIVYILYFWTDKLTD